VTTQLFNFHTTRVETGLILIHIGSAGTESISKSVL